MQLLSGGCGEEEITALTYDSRKAQTGSLFFCLRGARSNGEDFAPAAYAQGCRCFVSEGMLDVPEDADVVRVSDARQALAQISAAFFGFPQRELAEENCGRMRQFFMVDDLKYLRRGGRISAAAQVAGSLLKIKPILQSDPEGHIIQHSKVRGQLKAMETLAELYKEYAVDGTRTVGIAHADCPDGALRLQAKLRDAGQTGEILSVCYEPVTGGHVGPGTVALFFFGEVWR